MLLPYDVHTILTQTFPGISLTESRGIGGSIIKGKLGDLYEIEGNLNLQATFQVRSGVLRLKIYLLEGASRIIVHDAPAMQTADTLRDELKAFKELTRARIQRVLKYMGES